MSANNDVCRAFLEYTIAEKARDARIPWEQLEWSEDEVLSNGDRRVLSLSLRVGNSTFMEHFLEDEVQRYLVDPDAFNSVEAKTSYLLNRVRRGTRTL